MHLNLLFILISILKDFFGFTLELTASLAFMTLLYKFIRKVTPERFDDATIIFLSCAVVGLIAVTLSFICSLLK